MAPRERRTANNSVYLELGGPGAFYSINYERFVQDDVSLRIGFGYLSPGGSSSDVSTDLSRILAVPVTASYLGIGSGSHHFELGAGVVLAAVDATPGSNGMKIYGSGVAGTAIAGYRYAPPAGGFTFRAAFTPLFGTGGSIPWFGIAFGAHF